MQGAQTEVEVGHERAHAEFLGQGLLEADRGFVPPLTPQGIALQQVQQLPPDTSGCARIWSNDQNCVVTGDRSDDFRPLLVIQCDCD